LREFGGKLESPQMPRAMPTDLNKPRIFISYAPADEPETPTEGETKWLSFVTGFLRPAIKKGAAELWIDRLMPGDADWDSEIERKLRECDIFILLVSRHLLSSGYVVDKEVAIIRERQAKGEDVHFYPLLLTPTPKIALDLVRDKNLRPRDGKPFSDYLINERYGEMADAANEIAEIAEEISARKTRPKPLSVPAPDFGDMFIGGLRRRQEAPTAGRTPLNRQLSVAEMEDFRTPTTDTANRNTVYSEYLSRSYSDSIIVPQFDDIRIVASQSLGRPSGAKRNPPRFRLRVTLFLAGVLFAVLAFTQIGRSTWSHILSFLGLKLGAGQFPGSVDGHSVDPVQDVVECSVFGPPAAPPGETVLVQVFLHLPSQVSRVSLLASLMDSSTTLKGTDSFETPIKRGARVDIVFAVNGLASMNPSKASFGGVSPRFASFW